jgi:CubicO group peptidase (beta-lactamase class C family)
MRAPLAVALVLAAASLLCATLAAAETPAVPPASERLAADSPRATVRGNTFVAPAGWTLSVRGPATILEAPEGDSRIALVDVDAADADAAVAAAWSAFEPEASRPLKVATDRPDRDGWSKIRVYEYRTSPNERRDVLAFPRFANGSWLVVLYDVSHPVGEKRGAQISLVFDRLLPKGYDRESFAGRTAHPLTEERLAELRRFVETGREALRVPGVAVGIVQGGKVVFAEGFGVRELGKPEPVGADTLFLVASNTKAMTTLLLAKLVEQGKMTWKTPVTSLLPSFALGDPETTRQVLVEHLICACTGMPRQDFEWLLEYGALTPQTSLAMLGTMQPTSGFGEMFQYSNLMAGAAGYAAAHVLYPDMELGAGYDRAMQSQVFDPLGMRSTTFDFDRALAADHAAAHAPDVDGNPALAPMAVNTSVVPLRPAGGAWSNVPDMLRYVQMELDEGLLPDGTRYIAEEPLLARRDPQVALGNDGSYGMGLMVDSTYGIPVVHHGGDLIGHHSDMIWLPGQNVGAVILTSGDPGWTLRSVFSRKLLEVLFEGKPEADERVASAAKTFYEGMAADRKLMTVPADPAASAKLAARYRNASLGEIAVSRGGAATVFDFGEWKSEMATRSNPDGTVSFVTTAPGLVGFEFVVGTSGGKRSLVTRDAQHEYVFVEQ